MNEPNSKIPVTIEADINMASIKKTEDILNNIPNDKVVTIETIINKDGTKAKNSIDSAIKSIKTNITKSLNNLNATDSSNISKILSLNELENSISLLDEIGKKIKIIENQSGKKIENPYINIGEYLKGLDIGNLKIDTSSLDTAKESISVLRNELNKSINAELNIKENNNKNIINQLKEILELITKINQSIINININNENILVLKKTLENLQQEIISLNSNENSKIKLQFDEGKLISFKEQLIQIQNELNKIREVSYLSIPINNIKNTNSISNSENNLTQTSLPIFNEQVILASKKNIETIINELTKERQVPIKLKLSSTDEINKQMQIIKDSLQNIPLIIKVNQEAQNKEINNLISSIETKLNNLKGNISSISISEETIKNLNSNPIKISTKLELPSKDKFISDLQNNINQSNGISVKVDNLDAKTTGAITNLKSAIENELNNLFITINTKFGSNINNDGSNIVTNNASSVVTSYSNQLMFYKNLLNKLNLDTNKNADAIKTASANIEQYKNLLVETGTLGEESLAYITKLFETSPKTFVADKTLNTLNIKQQEELFKNYINTITKTNQQVSKQDDSRNIKTKNNELQNQVKILTDILNLSNEINRANMNVLVGKDTNGFWSDYIQNLNSQKSKLSSQLTGIFQSVIDNSSGNIDFNKLINLNELDNKQKSAFQKLYNNFLKKQYTYNKKIKEYLQNQNEVTTTTVTNNNTKGDFLKNANQTLKSITKIKNDIIKRNINPLIPSLEDSSTQIEAITQLNKLYDNLNEHITHYKNNLSSLSKTNNINQNQINDLEKTKAKILDVISQYNNLEKTLNSKINTDKSIIANTKLDSKYSKLVADIQKYMVQNGKALSNTNIKSQLNNLLNEASNPSNKSIQNLANLQTRFTNLQSQISKIGKTGRSVGQELDFIFSKIGLKAVFGTMIYQAIAYFKQMLVTVKDVDTSMVTLKRVTSETSKTYNEFLNNSSENTKKLATTITDIIDASSAWSRLGYSLRDSMELGNLSTMYSNVGFIDIDTATKDLVSAMKAFNIEADDATHIVDAFNEIGNKFAITSADIGSGLTQSASALNVAGNTLNESIAMITGIGEITQDTDSAGNALKTLSMRLRGAKTELEECGEDTDDLADSTSKMREEIKLLSGVDIMENDTTFKSTYQIMKEISSVWNDLSDVNQAGLLEKIAGKTRANQISALITNWSQVEKALATANTAEGSAEEENEKYVDSIAGKINVIKASAQELSTTAFSDTFLKSILDIVNSIINKVEQLSDKMGALPVLITAVGTAYGLLGKQFGNIGATPDWIKKKSGFSEVQKIISQYSINDLNNKISEINNILTKSDNNLTEVQKIGYQNQINQIEKLKQLLTSSNSNRIFNTKEIIKLGNEIDNTSDKLKNLDNILGYTGKNFSNTISNKILQTYDSTHMFGTSNGQSFSSVINNELSKNFDDFNNFLIEKQNGITKKYDDFLNKFKTQNTYLANYIKQQNNLGQKASIGNYQTYLQELSKSGKYETTGINGLKNVVVALNEYNKLATANATKNSIMNESQKDYLNTLTNLNPVLANNIQNMNRAKISIGQYMVSVTGAKTATLGLRIACGALNGVISGLASMAIMTVVSYIWNWITNINKLSDSMKENTSDIQNNTEALNEYIDKLKELKEAQKEAVSSNNKQDLVSTNEELISLQNELIDTYGEQVSGIDLVNASYEKLFEIMQKIQKVNANEFLQQANVGSDLKKAQNNLFLDEYNNNRIRLNIVPTDLNDKLLDELRNNDLNVPISTINKKVFIGVDGNSIDDAKKSLQSAYDIIKEYGIKTNKDYSKTLENIQKQINSYSTDTINDYESFYDSFLKSFIVSSDYVINGKTLNQWNSYVNELKNTLNDAVLNDDNETIEIIKSKLKKTQELLAEFNLDDLVETNSGFKTKGLSNYVDSWFDGYTEEVEKQLQKSKVKDLLNEYNFTISSSITDLTLNEKLQNVLSNPNYIDDKFVNELKLLKSIMDKTGVSAQELTDYLVELGYVTLDPSEWTPNFSTVLKNEENGISKIANDLFGIDNIETNKWKDSIENIKSAFENIKNENKLTSDDIFNIQNSELKNILKYNSQANEYSIDRQELEKLTKAKYDALKVDLERSRVALINARQSDLETIQNTKDPKIREEYQKIFDESEKQYNDAISAIDIAKKILEQNYIEFQDEINPTKITTGIIQTIENEFTTMSNAISKLNLGDSLSSEDIGNILETDYAKTLEINNETGLISINIEKYKELAQAKIDAYKINTQSTLNSLKEEQNLLTQTISYYKKNILENSNASSSSKEYASRQIGQMQEELNKVNSSIEENKLRLNQWSALSSRVASSIAGSFEDITSATKNLESSASTMSSAFKEVRDNGYLSLSTAVNLIDSGYANCVMLDKETNKLTLNATAYKQLAKQKINDQIASLKSIATTGQNTQQIQAQIQALQRLRDNLDSVVYGSYGDNQDYWKAEAEQQFAQLEHLHNMNVLDDVTYYQELEKLNNQYYKGKIKYINEYRQYEEEVYKGLLEAQINAQKELLNNEKEALETQKDGWNEQKEYWNDQKEALSEQKDYWNDLIDEINKQIKAINKEKDYWNDQKDLISEQKDAIQEQIDAIEEKNEEEEKALKIQEAQIRLQNALNQKNIREFSEETGWSWTTDKNEIKEAQQELDELLKEDEVSELEKQIDELDTQDKEIDKIIKQLDKEIDALEDQQDIYNDEIDLIDDSIDAINKEIDAIDKEIEAINKQEEILDKQIDAIEKQVESLNTSHVDELSGSSDSINKFTPLSQEDINQLLGLPVDFDTSLSTNIKEPMEDLKNSVDSTEQILSDLNKTTASDFFSKNSQIAQNLTVSINQVNTQNASEFIDQLGTILISQLK